MYDSAGTTLALVRDMNTQAKASSGPFRLVAMGLVYLEFMLFLCLLPYRLSP